MPMNRNAVVAKRAGKSVFSQAVFSQSVAPRFAMVMLASCLAVACGGGASESGSTSTDSRAVTEPPVSSTSGVDGSPDASGAEPINPIGQPIYYPPAEYPKAVTLPLQFITTTSGKRLSARVTLPADENGVPADGPFPTVLVQSGYNTNLLSQMFMGTPGNLLLGVSDSFIVRRGYAQVSVDAMGTGASEGGWELFGLDEQIGFAEAVDWVPLQSWSNGKVGVAGISYMAISSLYAAQQRPDTIQAVFASLPMGDAMRGTVGTGGLLNGLFMSTWMTITQLLSTQNVTTALVNPQHMTQLIQTTQEHVDQIDRYYLPLIQNAMDGAAEYSYDGEFWRTRSPLENIDKIKAPTLIMGALHDIFQRDEPLLFERLQKNNVDTRLIIYDGIHFGNFVTQHIGGEDVPPIDLLLLQWFDKHMKGKDTGAENIPAVVQHVKNYPTESTPNAFRDNSFSATTQWPHPDAVPERWYLHGDRRLTKTPPVNEETVHTMTNPEHPVVEIGKSDGLLKFDVTLNDGTECSRSFEQWTLGLTLPESCHHNSLHSTQEKVTYDSAVMEEDYYINGPIQADIWMESTVTEAVVAVQIEEVSDKQVLPITNGQLLASMREVDIERSRFLNGEMIQPYHYFTEIKTAALTPGQAVKMQIEIFPTSAIIRKGNKLRVSISPSNQAQGMLNYPRQALSEGGVTTLHNSPQYPSSVVFPVVPVSTLN